MGQWQVVQIMYLTLGKPLAKTAACEGMIQPPKHRFLETV